MFPKRFYKKFNLNAATILCILLPTAWNYSVDSRTFSNDFWYTPTAKSYDSLVFNDADGLRKKHNNAFQAIKEEYFEKYSLMRPGKYEKPGWCYAQLVIAKYAQATSQYLLDTDWFDSFYRVVEIATKTNRAIVTPEKFMLYQGALASQDDIVQSLIVSIEKPIKTLTFENVDLFANFISLYGETLNDPANMGRDKALLYQYFRSNVPFKTVLYAIVDQVETTLLFLTEAYLGFCWSLMSFGCGKAFSELKLSNENQAAYVFIADEERLKFDVADKSDLAGYNAVILAEKLILAYKALMQQLQRALSSTVLVTLYDKIARTKFSENLLSNLSSLPGDDRLKDRRLKNLQRLLVSFVVEELEERLEKFCNLAFYRKTLGSFVILSQELKKGAKKGNFITLEELNNDYFNTTYHSLSFNFTAFKLPQKELSRVCIPTDPKHGVDWTILLYMFPQFRELFSKSEAALCAASDFFVLGAGIAGLLKPPESEAFISLLSAFAEFAASETGGFPKEPIFVMNSDTAKSGKKDPNSLSDEFDMALFVNNAWLDYDTSNDAEELS